MKIAKLANHSSTSLYQSLVLKMVSGLKTYVILIDLSMMNSFLI